MEKNYYLQTWGSLKRKIRIKTKRYLLSLFGSTLFFGLLGGVLSSVTTPIKKINADTEMCNCDSLAKVCNEWVDWKPYLLGSREVQLYQELRVGCYDSTNTQKEASDPIINKCKVDTGLAKEEVCMQIYSGLCMKIVETVMIENPENKIMSNWLLPMVESTNSCPRVIEHAQEISSKYRKRLPAAGN